MSSEGLRMFEYLDKNAFVVSTSVFSAVATLTNLFLIVIILASPNLRISSKHILILALCLTDLYRGVSELPLLAQFYSWEKWIHDKNTLKALDESLYFVMLALTINLVIAICANSILSMLTRSRPVLLLLSASMIVGALCYSLVLVLPVTEGPPSPESLERCYWDIIGTKQTALSVAAFFPQAVVMIVLVVDIILIRCCVSSFMPERDEEPRRFPADVVLASILMLVYVVPHRIVHGYLNSCTGEETCRMMHIARGVTAQWVSVRPCVMPFVWLVCWETRMAVKKVCCCRRKESPPFKTGYMPKQEETDMTKL